MATIAPDEPAESRDADPGFVRDLEDATLASWPALQTIADGSWMIRIATGQTGRANAVTFLDPDDDGELDRRLATAVAIYRSHGLTPTFRTTPLTPNKVIEALGRADYRSINRTRVLWHPWCEPEDPPEGIEAEIGARPTDEWLEATAANSGFSEAKRQGMELKLARLRLPAAFVVLRVDGAPAATVLATVHGGRLGLFDLGVAPDHRRQGLARAAMAVAIRWGQTRGALPVWLQVVAGNAPAEALYRELGFREIYTYGYRTPAEAAT